jgi:hypothetical protein
MAFGIVSEFMNNATVNPQTFTGTFTDKDGNPMQVTKPEDAARLSDKSKVDFRKEGNAISAKVFTERTNSQGAGGINANTSTSAAGVQTPTGFSDSPRNQDSNVNPELGFDLATFATADVPMRPTIKNLVEKFTKFSYRAADFWYCKYYGVIPNNYMITLCRYKHPVNDYGRHTGVGVNVEKNKGFETEPIAKAITFLGKKPGNTLDEILHISGGMLWDEAQAEDSLVPNTYLSTISSKDIDELLEGVTGSLKDVAGVFKGLSETKTGKGSLDALSSILKTSGTLMAKAALAAATSKRDPDGELDFRDDIRINEDQYDPYQKDGIFANKSFGGVNRIRSTSKRAEGFRFSHDFALKFHYQAKSIGDINAKVALLDILQNMMQLTLSNADFYGGANRYTPGDGVLELDTKIKEKILVNDVDATLKYFKDEIIPKISDQVKSNVQDFFKSVVQFFDSPGSSRDMKSNKTLDGIKRVIATKVFKLLGWVSEPAKVRSLLTGLDVGEWHVIIGNPFNPVAQIGNLICEGYEINWPTDQLGYSDFPEEVSFTVRLKSARPRDKRAVTNIFGLITTNKGGTIQTRAEEASSTRDSIVDDSPFKADMGEVLRRAYFRPGELIDRGGRPNGEIGQDYVSRHLIKGSTVGVMDFIGTSGDPISIPTDREEFYKRDAEGRAEFDKIRQKDTQEQVKFEIESKNIAKLMSVLPGHAGQPTGRTI